MRVLLVNTVCGIGSTGRICTDLYDELIKSGHECCIAYGRGTSCEKYKTYRVGNIKDTIFHYGFSLIFGRNGLHSKKATKEFIKFIESYKPDIIHLHNIHGYYINYEILFNYFKHTFKGKIVWTLHDCWTFSGGNASIDYDAKVGLMQSHRGLFGNYGYPRAIFNRSKKNLEQKEKSFGGLPRLTVVTPSEWLKNLAEKTFLSKNKIFCIHNGINLTEFNIINKKERNARKKILAVASIWTKTKGINDILKLASECPEYDFLIVGKIPKIKSLSKRNMNNVTFVNKTNSLKELMLLYNDADVFINPTYLDNFPTTNLESLACGTPVITYNTGGSPESIDQNCGKICEERTVLSLKNSIELLFKEHDEEGKYSRKICRSCAQLYGKKEFVKNYIKIYNII